MKGRSWEGGADVASPGAPGGKARVADLGKVSRIADASLILVSLIWGSGFVVVKWLVGELDPISLVMHRFLAASLIMGLVFSRRLLRGLHRRVLVEGLTVGALLFWGFALQSVGLRYTTASSAGFITGFSVVLVPFFSATILKRPPSEASMFGVFLAELGLVLLVLKPGDGFPIGTGDILVLLGAICFALHVIYVAKYAPYRDVSLLVVLQLFTVTLLSAAMAGLMRVAVPGAGVGAPWLPRDIRTWAGILYLAAFGTAGAFFVQNAAQRFTTPTHVAVIFSMEPVFGAVFARVFLEEFLGLRAYLGALLILVGTLVCELKPSWR